MGQSPTLDLHLRAASSSSHFAVLDQDELLSPLSGFDSDDDVVSNVSDFDAAGRADEDEDESVVIVDDPLTGAAAGDQGAKKSYHPEEILKLIQSVQQHHAVNFTAKQYPQVWAAVARDVGTQRKCASLHRTWTLVKNAFRTAVSALSASGYIAPSMTALDPHASMAEKDALADQLTTYCKKVLAALKKVTLHKAHSLKWWDISVAKEMVRMLSDVRSGGGGVPQTANVVLKVCCCLHHDWAHLECLLASGNWPANGHEES